MEIWWPILFMFFAVPGLAAPFELELISQAVVRDDPNDASYRSETKVYKVKDRPLLLQVRVVARKGVEVYQTFVYDPAAPGVTLAGAHGLVFFKRGKVESLTLSNYGKNQGLPLALFERPEYKGIGELSLQPMLSLPNIPIIQATLAHTNYTRMDRTITDRGQTVSLDTLNDVVMEVSHLGPLLKPLGFEVDRAWTSQDSFRHEVTFRFLSESARRTLWQRCWDLLPDLRWRKP